MINLIQIAHAVTETELQNAGSVGNYVTLLYKWGIPFAGGLAVLMFTYIGYLYITSGGNPDNIKTAKDYLIGTILGLTLIILAGVLLKNIIGTNY